MAITAMSEAIEPASEGEFAAAISKVLRFGETFELPTPKLSAALEIYGEHLADLPAAVLAEAVRKTLSGWTWGNRLPFPGDIRRNADTIMDGWKIMLMRLQVVERRIRSEARTHG